jgi:endonuclease YncB( thermonuclease family)
MRSCRGEIKESLGLPIPAGLTVGLAWQYKQYAGEQGEEDRERYAFAEVEARARREGLWREGDPVAPWE